MVQAYRGELAEKEQQVKEAEQAGQVASLKRQLAKKKKTNKVSTLSIIWHKISCNFNHFHV